MFRKYNPGLQSVCALLLLTDSFIPTTGRIVSVFEPRSEAGTTSLLTKNMISSKSQRCQVYHT